MTMIKHSKKYIKYTLTILTTWLIINIDNIRFSYFWLKK